MDIVGHLATRNNSLDAAVAMNRSYDKRSGQGSTVGRNSGGSYYSPKSGYAGATSPND